MSADLEPFDLVRSRLTDARAERGGIVARCPAHDDGKPSLRLSRGEGGRALLCCRAHCPTEAVVQALGLRMSDLMPREASALPAPSAPAQAAREGFATAREAVQRYRDKLGPEAARWTYTSPSGEPVAVVLRWNHDDGTKRDIRPVALVGGRWRLQAPEGDRCLYRLDELGGGGPVLVAEGEKAADALASLGFSATTSMGGAKAAAKSSWASLAGREVFILPDEDNAGLRYAEEVRALCESLEPPAKARVLRLVGLEPDSGEDAVEWIGRVHKGDGEAARAALASLLNDARKPKPPKGGLSLGALAREPDALKPPPCIPSGLAAFDNAQPWGAIAMGSLVTVGGEVGAGKSRFLLTLAVAFAKRGVRVAYLLGEMNAKQLLRRAVCAEARLGFKALKNPTPDQRAKLEAAQRTVAALDNLEVIEPGAGLDELREWSEWAQVLFLDPLQPFAEGVRKDSEHERITALMRELAALCAKGLVVFTASEISQGSAADKEVGNGFKGSSSIRQYSLACYWATKPEGTNQTIACWKQREGEQSPLFATVRTGWQGIDFVAAPEEGGAGE